MPDFYIEVAGDVQLHRRFSRFTDAVQDLTPAFEHIVTRLQQASETLFDSQGNGKWPALSPAYALWKAKNYPGRSLMRRTDTLHNDLITNPGHIEPQEMRWGTSVPYAIHHQQGTSRMPQRKIIDLTEEDKRGMMKDIQEWLVKQGRPRD